MKTYKTNPATQTPTADGSYIAFYPTGIPTLAIYTTADGWNDADIVEWLEETKPHANEIIYYAIAVVTYRSRAKMWIGRFGFITAQNLEEAYKIADTKKLTIPNVYDMDDMQIHVQEIRASFCIHPQLVKWDEALRENDCSPNLLIGLGKEKHLVLIPPQMTKIEAHDLLLDALHNIGEQLDAEEVDEKTER